MLVAVEAQRQTFSCIDKVEGQFPTARATIPSFILQPTFPLLAQESVHSFLRQPILFSQKKTCKECHQEKACLGLAQGHQGSFKTCWGLNPHSQNVQSRTPMIHPTVSHIHTKGFQNHLKAAAEGDAQLIAAQSPTKVYYQH